MRETTENTYTVETQEGQSPVLFVHIFLCQQKSAFGSNTVFYGSIPLHSTVDTTLFLFVQLCLLFKFIYSPNDYLAICLLFQKH